MQVWLNRLNSDPALKFGAEEAAHEPARITTWSRSTADLVINCGPQMSSNSR